MNDLEDLQKVASIPPTTSGKLGSSVPLGDLVAETDTVYIRYHRHGDDLWYHVFRGPKVKTTFWGRGDFGVCLVNVVDSLWPTRNPQFQFYGESLRPEATNDDLSCEKAYPDHFYGSYFAQIPCAYLPFQPSAAKIGALANKLEEAVKDAGGVEEG